MGNGVQSAGDGPRLEDRAVDELARRAQRGESPAAAELCVTCTPALRRYFSSALRRSDDDPEDAVQQVLLKMLEALPRFRYDGTPFRAWLFRIAHNVAVDRMRASARRATATDPRDLVEASEIESGSAEEAEPAGPGALRTLIAPLPRFHQQVLTLLYVHDMTPAQAGAVLGRSPEAIRQAHKRARDSLRARVMTAGAAV